MHWFGNLSVALALAFCGAAGASGLQVSPVSLTLPPAQNADGLWLSNTGNGVVQAQVRVYRWTQEGGQDKLAPTRALLVSPPMLELPVDGRQLIRAIRAGAPPEGPAEQAYRLVIDELPVATEGKKGLQYVLRYSVPVFIAPAGAAPSAHQLQWSLRRDGEALALQVVNSGGTHAQLADLSFIDSAGRSVPVHAGLLGYVLPGAQMRWPLKPSSLAPAERMTLQAMINGSTEQIPVALVDGAH